MRADASGWFYQLELKAHFGSYQIHAVQIKHELAVLENQRDQSRFLIWLLTVPTTKFLIQ